MVDYNLGNFSHVLIYEDHTPMLKFLSSHYCNFVWPLDFLQQVLISCLPTNRIYQYIIMLHTHTLSMP